LYFFEQIAAKREESNGDNNQDGKVNPNAKMESGQKTATEAINAIAQGIYFDNHTNRCGEIVHGEKRAGQKEHGHNDKIDDHRESVHVAKKRSESRADTGEKN